MEFTVGGPLGPGLGGDEVSAEANKGLVRRFYEDIWNKGEMAVADEVIADNVIDHDQSPDTRVSGPASLKELATWVRSVFPDFHFTVEDMIAEGDRVAVRWTMGGTHCAEFMGAPATGKRVVGRGMHFFRMAEGKIVEIWVNGDDLGMMQQIGSLPSI